MRHCIGICELDKEGKRCVGCKRTIEEIIAKGEGRKYGREDRSNNKQRSV